jgi:hypothetical protein
VAICKFDTFKYYLFIFILPKIDTGILDFEVTEFWKREDFEALINIPFIDYEEFEGDYDDYDWEREAFNALTDGQYGDYDEFDGDWDGLDDWRGG